MDVSKAKWKVKRNQGKTYGVVCCDRCTGRGISGALSVRKHKSKLINKTYQSTNQMRNDTEKAHDSLAGLLCAFCKLWVEFRIILKKNV